MDNQSYDFDKGFLRGLESRLSEIHTLKARVYELERAVSTGSAPRPEEDYEKLERRIKNLTARCSDLSKVVERFVATHGPLEVEE